MSYRTQEAMNLPTLIVAVLVMVVVLFGLGSVCWTYSINHWVLHFHAAHTIKWWQGGLMGLVPGLGQLGLVAAVATWILSIFIG